MTKYRIVEIFLDREPNDFIVEKFVTFWNKNEWISLCKFCFLKDAKAYVKDIRINGEFPRIVEEYEF